MEIDWTQAPEGTTHGMVNGGEMRWYRVGEHVECWHTKYREWIRSFFLSIEEVRDSGLYLYANGEQSEMVMLRKERDDLLVCLKWMVGIYERDNRARNEPSTGAEYYAAISAISRSEAR